MNGVRRKESADAQRRHQKARLDPLNQFTRFRKQGTDTFLLALFLTFTKQDRQCASGGDHIQRWATRGKLCTDFCLINLKLLRIFLRESSDRFILRNSIESRQNSVSGQD